MNLSSLRIQTASFCGDPDQTRFSATQYLNALNRSHEQFALDTKALWKEKTWSHAASDADEDLPTDFMWEHWVTYDGVKLLPISRYELLQKSGDDWTDDAASLPTHFIIDPEEAVKEIVLYPIPTTAKTLAMRYFPMPTALASDSDIPLNSSALMVQFHIGISAYAAKLLLLSEQITPAIKTKINEMDAIYADSCTKAVDTMKNTASAGLKIKGMTVWG